MQFCFIYPSILRGFGRSRGRVGSPTALCDELLAQVCLGVCMVFSLLVQNKEPPGLNAGGNCPGVAVLNVFRIGVIYYSSCFQAFHSHHPVW